MRETLCLVSTSIRERNGKADFILSVTEAAADDLEIQDVVTTILCLYNPLFLLAFLDLDNLTASFYHKDTTAGCMNILIVRDGDMVECGFYEEVDDYRLWDCRVVFTILPHGEWIPEYAYSAGQHYFSASAVRDIAASLGFSLLLNKPWVAGKGAKITSTYED